MGYLSWTFSRYPSEFEMARFYCIIIIIIIIIIDNGDNAVIRW